jgi:hypothetical protein
MSGDIELDAMQAKAGRTARNQLGMLADSTKGVGIFCHHWAAGDDGAGFV